MLVHLIKVWWNKKESVDLIFAFMFILYRYKLISFRIWVTLKKRIMLVVLPHAMTVEIRKRTSAQVFSSNFFEIFHGSLFFSTPPSECSRSKSDHLKFLKQIIIFICTSAKSIISRLAVLCPAIIIDNGITKWLPTIYN